MQHYGLSELCDLGFVNVKISGTFIERLLVESLPDVVMSMACIEFFMLIQAAVARIKK